MSELVEAVDLDVRPDYRMFGLGDEYGVNSGEAPIPGRGFVGVGTHSFRVGTGGNSAHPAVRLEHWKDGLPEPMPEHEAQETFEIECPTGELALDFITMGGDAGFMTLPAGTHTVRVTGWERESTRVAEDALYVHDFDSAEFEQDLEALHGRERYLIQFALKTASARLLDSTGRGIRGGLDQLILTDRSRTRHAAIPAAGVESLELQIWDAPPPRADPDPAHVALADPDLEVLPVLPGGQKYTDLPYSLPVPAGIYLADWYTDDEDVPCCVIRLWPGSAAG